MYLLSYFIIYSLLGWVLESVFKTIGQKKFVNSGFLIGPFCPIYGVGAIIMIITLSSFRTNIILLFFISLIVLSIWEYIVGVFLEKVFKTKYWDYSDHKCNFQGRVCLINSIFWGVLGVFFIYIIHPFIANEINRIQPNIIIYLNILIYSYLIVDMIISTIKVKNIDVSIQKLNEISENIKEKIERLEKLKKSSSEKQINLENLQHLIDDLKLKQRVLRRRIYRHAYRLKKAFPTMKSEKITEFLNQKVDMIRNKTKEK